MLRILLNEIPLYRRIIYWLITGVVFSLCFGAMLTTRDGSINQFFDDGYVWDLEDVWKNNNIASNLYNADTDTYTFPESGESLLYLGEPMEGWKYFYIDISGIESDTIKAVVNAYDKDWNNIGRGGKSLVEGGNLFRVPVGEGIAYVYVSFVSKTPNVEYQINEMRISEYAELSDYSMLPLESAKGGIIFFAISLFVFLIFRNIIKKREYNLNFTNTVSISVPSISLYSEELKSFVNKYQSVIRTICFLMIVIGWRLIWDFGVRINYGYGAIMQIILFFVIIVTMQVESKNYKCEHYLTRIIVAYLLLTIVSDLIVFKYWGFVGALFLLSFGPLTVFWSVMKRPEDIFDDFFSAAEILFLMNLIYSIFSDKAFSFENRLQGTWSNPNPFSLAILLYTSIFLIQLYMAICNRKVNIVVWKVLEIVAGCWMMIEAKCRTALAAFVCVFSVYIIYIMYNTSKNMKKKYVLSIMLVVVAGTIMCGGVLILNGKIAGRNIDFTSIDSITTGRVGIWMDHIKNMNLIGHKYLMESPDGDLKYAHNGLIKTFYKYGVICGVFAVIVFVESFFALINSRHRIKKEYFLFCLMIFVMYFIALGTECLNEFPMYLVTTFAFYLTVSYILVIVNREKMETTAT